ncbi:MAG: phosphatidylglycerol lysyltransferase domain-containing protein [Myxococcota bacterium]
MGEETERVLAALKAWGEHPTSFQILEEGNLYWFDPEVPSPGAVVAYRECGRYRVAAGVPIAPPESTAAVAGRFIAEGIAAGQRTLFFSADQDFVDALSRREGSPPVDSVAIGEQPEWDPARYTTEGSDRASLRAQLHRARNKGVEVRTVSEDEIAHAPGPVRAEIETVLQRWLASRRMSAMAFLVDLQPFHQAAERRYYIAEHNGRAVGFLSAIPVYQRSGWFFEDVLRVPEAPNGTVELLIDTAMRDAASRGDQFVTLGLSPLAEVDTGPGPHRRLRRGLKWAHDHLGGLYNFQGVRDFKARFKPDRWRTQLLVSSPKPLEVGAIHAVLQAFSGGGLLAFGLDSLRRWGAQVPPQRWSATLWLLAALLVPWTLLLASADGERWFGDPSIQSAWVAFDTAMVVALTALGALVHWGKRGARPLALLLAGATGADFLLTTAQALNLHQSVSGLEALFVAAGALGPLIATGLLIGLADALPSRRVLR